MTTEERLHDLERELARAKRHNRRLLICAAQFRLNQYRTTIGLYMNMKRMAFWLLSGIGAIMLVAGCAGHEPNPIATHQIGDDNRSCTSLQLEIAQNEALAIKKTKTGETKVWTNIGWFLLFPPLMDVKDSENTEAQALRARNDYLRILISEKEPDHALTSRPSVQ